MRRLLSSSRCVFAHTQQTRSLKIIKTKENIKIKPVPTKPPPPPPTSPKVKEATVYTLRETETYSEKIFGLNPATGVWVDVTDGTKTHLAPNTKETPHRTESVQTKMWLFEEKKRYGT